MKQWLQDNKIYFETITACFLSLMAIVIGISQAIIARIQVNIARKQVDLQLAEHSPKFYIRSYLVRNPQTNNFDDEVVEVQNEGEIARDVTTSTAVYLDIRVISSDGRRSKLSLPLTGYFFAIFRTGNSRGTIYRIEGKDNNRKYGEIYHSFYNAPRDPRIWVANIDLRQYVSVSYQTIHGQKLIDYFRLNAGSGGELLDPEYGADIFREHLHSTMLKDISEVTSKQLMELAIRAADNKQTTKEEDLGK